MAFLLFYQQAISDLPTLENIFEYQKYCGGGGVFQYIYLKFYLNNKKQNAAEKHGRDVLFYGHYLVL